MNKVCVPVVLLSAAVLLMGCSSDNSGRQGPRGDHPPSPAALMKELDGNKDGVLSRKEVNGPLADHFAEVDSNKDGVLSLAELHNMPKRKGRP